MFLFGNTVPNDGVAQNTSWDSNFWINRESEESMEIEYTVDNNTPVSLNQDNQLSKVIKIKGRRRMRTKNICYSCHCCCTNEPKNQVVERKVEEGSQRKRKMEENNTIVSNISKFMRARIGTRTQKLKKRRITSEYELELARRLKNLSMSSDSMGESST